MIMRIARAISPILMAIVVSIISGVAVLNIEYKSGYFIRLESAGEPSDLGETQGKSAAQHDAGLEKSPIIPPSAVLVPGLDEKVSELMRQVEKSPKCSYESNPLRLWVFRVSLVAFLVLFGIYLGEVYSFESALELSLNNMLPLLLIIWVVSAFISPIQNLCEPEFAAVREWAARHNFPDGSIFHYSDILMLSMAAFEGLALKWRS
jgi:hypothetical protein